MCGDAGGFGGRGARGGQVCGADVRGGDGGGRWRGRVAGEARGREGRARSADV